MIKSTWRKRERERKEEKEKEIIYMTDDRR